MLRTIAVLILLLFTILPYSRGQVSTCLGDDVFVCADTPVAIESCSGTGITSPVYTLNNPTVYNLADDYYGPIINLGFDFEFYGVSYNQIVVSDNGTISFNVSNANDFASWEISSIPTSEVTMVNTIMSVWQDLYQPHGGTVYVETIGTAPNRVAVILWDGLSMFSSSCQSADQCFTGGVLLFEDGNIIETHISNKTTCLAWEGGRATHGLNKNIYVADVVPGRNNQVFDLENDGYRFTPNGTNNYIINPIPFSIITKTNNNNIVWHDTNGKTYPYNNGTLNTKAQSGTVGYYLASSTCGTGVGSISDTTFVTGLSSSVAATSVTDVCSAGIGSVTANPLSGTSPYTFNWPELGSTSQSVANIQSGTYFVEMTDADGCVSSASVTVEDTPLSYSTSSTLVSCAGRTDGTATVNVPSTMGNISYQWNDPSNQTTNTATGLSVGVYECLVTSDLGCSESVSVTVGETSPMQIQIVNQTDVTCNSGNDGAVTIAVENGTTPYAYSWTGSSSVTPTANDLSEGTTKVTISDANGCIATEEITIGEPSALLIDAIVQDTTICIGDSVQLYAEVSGGSSSYIYEWKANGVVVGNTDVIYVTPTASPTEYHLIVSEQCGSPSVEDRVEINHPEEVDPMLLPDKTNGCFPVQVTLENITNTIETIDYTVWKYPNGERDTTLGSNSVIHSFGEGFSDVEMEIVTERGCRYVKYFFQLIEGYSLPSSDFYVTPNPAPALAPIVEAFSQSSSDVIAYNWFAEGALPDHSSLENLTFTYPSEAGYYPLVLVVENQHGCIDSVEKFVRIENEVLVFSPNSFTPNGDGLNDTWKVDVSIDNMHSFHLQLFNRWGEIVFESFDQTGAWDGTYGNQLAPTGIYLWKIRAVDSESNERREFQGFVNLLK